MASLFFGVAPLLSLNSCHFKERVGLIGTTFVLGVIALLVVARFSGWIKSSNEWFGRSGLLPMFAVLPWLALVAAGYNSKGSRQ
jgi:hypothetical protein